MNDNKIKLKIILLLNGRRDKHIFILWNIKIDKIKSLFNNEYGNFFTKLSGKINELQQN
jgi:hypothetical protein